MKKTNSRKPNGYWTKERLLATADSCKTLKEFRENHSAAYDATSRSEFKNEILDRLYRVKKANFFWNKKNILEEAKKYSSRSEFQQKSGGAYNAARGKNILDEVCLHMVSERKPHGYWTNKKILEEAKKSNHKIDFLKNSPSAHRIAVERGILDEVCEHMTPKASISERALYAFEFPDRSVYVGLTYNYEKRYDWHMTYNEKLIKKTKELGHKFVKLDNWYDMHVVSDKEIELIEDYKSKGWKILNVAKAGALGSAPIKWTNRAIRLEAIKYNTRTNFQKGNPSAYTAAWKKGLLDEVCSHMSYVQKPDGYWTKKRLLSIADSCKTLKEFRENHSAAYDATSRSEFKNEILKKLKRTRKENFFWNKKNILKEAKKYSSRIEFQRQSSGAYEAARKNNILDEVCSHMSSVQKPNGFWTKERCIEEAKKYSSRTEFRQKSGGAYSAMKRKNWYIELKKIF